VNVVILRGILSRPPTARELPSGDQLVAFEVTTRRADGPAESVPVAWLGAPLRAQKLQAGAEVVVTGRVRRRFFRASGDTASRTEVVADVVMPASHSTRVAQAVERAVADTRPMLSP